MRWVGVGGGGVVTGAVVCDETGARRRASASSTPTDPDQGEPGAGDGLSVPGARPVAEDLA